MYYPEELGEGLATPIPSSKLQRKHAENFAADYYDLLVSVKQTVSENLGLLVRFVPHTAVSNEKISSTRIRMLLDSTQDNDLPKLVSGLVAALQKSIEMIKQTKWWQMKEDQVRKQAVHKDDSAQSDVLMSENEGKSVMRNFREMNK